MGLVPSARYSIVIPTLNEEENLPRAIESARIAYGSDCEIIVVDGGSTDATRDVARRHGRVLVRGAGRGSQLNAGAARATGEILVFLHADTRVAPESEREIQRLLRDERVAGGCHRFRVDPPAASLRFRLLETAVNLRTRIFKTATGDQAIFVPRSRFQEVGGFPDYPILEDIGFVRRLRSSGRFVPIEAAAHTSRRRWDEGGFVATVLLHLGLRLAFRLGASPRSLARWYTRAGWMTSTSSLR